MPDPAAEAPHYNNSLAQPVPEHVRKAEAYGSLRAGPPSPRLTPGPAAPGNVSYTGELCNMLDNINSRFANIEDRLHGLADRIIGTNPEGGGSETNVRSAESALGRIHQSLEALAYWSERISGHVDRLERL